MKSEGSEWSRSQTIKALIVMACVAALIVFGLAYDGNSSSGSNKREVCEQRWNGDPEGVAGCMSVPINGYPENQTFNCYIPGVGTKYVTKENCDTLKDLYSRR